jgi:hypothetical protein
VRFPARKMNRGDESDETRRASPGSSSLFKGEYQRNSSGSSSHQVLSCTEGPKGGYPSPPRTTRFLAWVVHKSTIHSLGSFDIESTRTSGSPVARCLPQLISLGPIRLKHVPLLGLGCFKALVHPAYGSKWIEGGH